MLKVVLVDDEHPALQAMQYLLNKHEEVEVVGAFTDPDELLAEVDILQPNVLFLDIEMRDTNGLALAEKLYEINPSLHIVFVTAYNEYAVSAFELNAVDYLLKPVSETRLEKTMQRIVKEQRGNELISKQDEQTSAARHVIHVRSFGRFQVAIGGVHKDGIVKWRTAKAEELFALFIHHEGNALHKDFIIEQLWPDALYENALMKLHTLIYQIRKVLKPLRSRAELRFSQNCYQLLLYDLDCDVKRFRQLVKEADGLTDERLIKVVNEAMDLHRGRYVEENGYMWSLDESSLLADQFTDLLVRAADNFINRKQDKKAIPYLHRLLQLDSLNEDYYIQLFSLYARLQDYASLTELYEKLTNVLQQELGESPHPNTTAYYKTLLTNE